MRETIRRTIFAALSPLFEEAGLETEGLPLVSMETPPDDRFGDFSTNAAMVLAKPLKMPPRKIAERILPALEGNPIFASVSIAGPGFINFTIKKEKWREEFSAIPMDSSDYGNGKARKGEKVLVEFVSANPTGPLHIGHGRGAALGDVITRILKKAGYDVTTEYYINDSGLQMENLGRSTLARYKELLGREATFPESGYQGEYIRDIAREITDKHGTSHLDTPEAEALPFFITYTADNILDDIKADLERFRVTFDEWTSEKTFHESGKVEGTLGHLMEKGAIYEKDGAWWLKTMDAGDEKDRVVKRSNGATTYYAADISYHADKYTRGFTHLIDIWGADHHGYVARMKAAVAALGYDPDSLSPLLIQLVSLRKGGETIAMSTRAGKFTTLKEVLDEVGVDAARFTFLTRSHDSQLDFDLDLAKKESSENPVYYVQYAHARISNIFNTARERGVASAGTNPPWERLELDEETAIMKKALAFPDLVQDCAYGMVGHPITHYLIELAGMFHRYYNVNRVVSDDEGLTAARLGLVARIRTVLKNGLDLLGVSAPDKM